MYCKGLTAFVTYGMPHDGLQQSEVWAFQSNPFPGHDALGHAAVRSGSSQHTTQAHSMKL